jgi:RNA polymerase-binding transcription factor DksA
MTRVDLEQYRKTLLSLRTRLKGDLSHLSVETLREDGSDLLRSGPERADDTGADSAEQELSLSLLSNQEQALEEIDGALLRIGQGVFGQCEECRKAIARARLQALPYTRHCVACARKLQQSQ